MASVERRQARIAKVVKSGDKDAVLEDQVLKNLPIYFQNVHLLIFQTL